MTEVRFHGRGGQGAVGASEILVTTFFHEGKAETHRLAEEER